MYIRFNTRMILCIVFYFTDLQVYTARSFGIFSVGITRFTRIRSTYSIVWACDVDVL